MSEERLGKWTQKRLRYMIVEPSWRVISCCIGKTDRIDISSFYPLLAVLADICHSHSAKDMHPGLIHQVVSPPGVFALPDGTASKVVSLGRTLPMEEMGGPKWWPGAPSEKARRKLFARIGREGEVLPIVTAVCISLLSSIYTTTSSKGSKQRRVRLQYKSSPIADFGIVQGAADVKCQDQLAYFDEEKLTFTKGQNPMDHYWIYFRTVRGEDVIFDPSLFTFNFCIMTPTSPYVDGMAEQILPEGGPSSYAPAFLFGRDFRKGTIGLHSERHRVSILRNQTLQRAIRHMGNLDPTQYFMDEDVDHIWDFIDKFAGPSTPLPDRWNVITSFIIRTSWGIEDVLRRRAWEKWPAEAPIAIDSDEGEMTSEEEDPKWFRSLKKWTKKYNIGEIDRQTYDRKVRRLNV